MTTVPHHYRVSESMLQRVLGFVIDEADLDGLATVTTPQIAKALGTTQATAWRAVHQLRDDGFATSVSTHAGTAKYYTKYTEIQLADGVIP